MKAKRILFIISLLALFCVCFTIMNRHYDELARYPYVTDENRSIILEHLSSDDINYMISQQLTPEQFIPFIETKGFMIRNTLWYTRAKEIQDASNETIIAFINDFKDKLDYPNLEPLLEAYSYDTLRTFYEEDNGYVQNASIVNDPAALLTRMEENETLYTYEPKNLVTISDLPNVSSLQGSHAIRIQKEAVQPLHDLCKDISSVNDKTCGNLILTLGYVSYQDQIPLYEQMMLKYGKDQFDEYWDYPGQSEYQLGYTVRFQPAGAPGNDIDIDYSHLFSKESESVKDKEMIQLAQWLNDNAYQYGFIVRYPNDQINETHKKYQPFTLRYVGKDAAKTLHDQNQVLEEYQIEIK